MLSGPLAQSLSVDPKWAWVVFCTHIPWLPHSWRVSVLPEAARAHSGSAEEIHVSEDLGPNLLPRALMGHRRTRPVLETGGGVYEPS